MSATRSAVAPGSQTALRRANKQRLLTELDAGTSLSQATLARATGLSAATVSNLVAELERDGEVVVTHGTTNGRASRLIDRHPERRPLALGLSLGTKFARVAVGTGETVLDVRSEDLRSPGQPAVLQEVADLARRALTDVGGRLEQVSGAVMALPAPVHRGRIAAVQVPAAWRGVDVVAEMSELIGVPVRVANDANLGAVALAHHLGTDAPVAFVKWTSGIGAGLAVGGAALEGGGGMAGEIGHLTARRPGGRVCRCGRTSCLESVASVEAIRESASIAVSEELDEAGLIARLQAGDPVVRRVTQEAAEALAEAMGTLTVLYNPSVIAVAGPLVHYVPDLVDELRLHLRRAVTPALEQETELVLNPLGGEAEVRGALRVAAAPERALLS
ncbi:ROK family transcriptional regulator [Nocardioides sp. GY 10127]|uniref:ROK family transcriptional regulator n=1 Tax=Nocardioides sp. GY 10127 TaxID=2569762 RepID=UPI0010A8B2EF|nr:ROK family transcriptional regulator [Nocardioides sp. GY 10127]TIC79316.1 ROK family transcriptional regulator [Nocardioides sp. GY 10127]